MVEPIDRYHKLLNIIKGVDADNFDEYVVLTVDNGTRTLRINNWVWDPDLTPNPDWVRMKQPTLEFSGDLTVTMGDVEKLLSKSYWKDERYEYSAGNIIYSGFNTTHKAATSATTWYISKYTWTGSDMTRKQGPLVGAWNNRASLSWT